ncbi:hypothetical protein HUE58_01900 [Candidatus Ruthia endofausta]|uniref:Uncharacterized protein n=1 Tax=Candidatus Ruthia endofausta TaxID=2738852 RepID=A0A6N0HNP0_9GAMM|nr:hypothetical protein [Candidatus Ruthia endofausta]QKQ23946.1 hypothetical protein HUE58_01900 [Candidatus Ruthia endofausta]
MSPWHAFFTTRKVACEMYEDILCVVACPTDALSKQLTSINDAQMRLARIVDTQ